MDLSTLKYLQDCSRDAAGELTNPSDEQMRAARVSAAEAKRNAQAYIEKLEQGMWENYQRRRRAS